MQTLLLVAELIIAVALIIFVLLQRSEGGALGMGGGSAMGGLFTPRGAADTLTRTTAILALPVLRHLHRLEPCRAARPQRDIDP